MLKFGKVIIQRETFQKVRFSFPKNTSCTTTRRKCLFCHLSCQGYPTWCLRRMTILSRLVWKISSRPQVLPLGAGKWRPELTEAIRILHKTTRKKNLHLQPGLYVRTFWKKLKRFHMTFLVVSAKVQVFLVIVLYCVSLSYNRLRGAVLQLLCFICGYSFFL